MCYCYPMSETKNVQINDLVTYRLFGRKDSGYVAQIKDDGFMKVYNTDGSITWLTPTNIASPEFINHGQAVAR